MTIPPNRLSSGRPAPRPRSLLPKHRSTWRATRLGRNPPPGKEQDLFAKALAIEDRTGNRVIFVTLDLIGVTADLRTAVSERVQKEHGVAPKALVMNASHTHCGPAYSRDDASGYLESLKDTLVKLVGQAIENLEPASLSYGFARCGFAMNRRTPTDSGYRNHPNPEGPRRSHGAGPPRRRPGRGLRSVLFGYACHNTTMGFRYWQGDYAGFAQQYLEEDHPDVTALFMQGCGADQNPYPRSELPYAQRHGRSLATAVEAALRSISRRRNTRSRCTGPYARSWRPSTWNSTRRIVPTSRIRCRSFSLATT